MQHTYSIARIIGEELNLASWQSSTKSLNLKSPNIWTANISGYTGHWLHL